MVTQDSDKKKILIIAYYWPPAGGPGVQRWLKFIKYLPEFGIAPHLYIPENPSYPIIDENLTDDISGDVVIIKKKIFEPYQIASFFGRKKTQKISSGIISKNKNQSVIEKILLWIRGNIFIPDARIFWVRPSVKFLTNYISQNGITTVITTGPPHSLHLIGLKLKQKNSIKWIVDFRDPWTTIGYQKSLKLSAFSKRKHLQLEKQVLQAADQIIVTSPTTKVEFSVLTNQPISVITNGFDSIVNLDAVQTDKMFTVAHIGSLLSERNPLFLWEIFSELKNEIPNFSADFQLKLVGKVSEEVLFTIQNYGLIDSVNNIGYLSHNKSIEEQKKSQILLLIEIDSNDTKCIIPGKLFEYLISNRPIIAIGPTGSDIKKIVEESQAGIFVDYHQKEILKSHIINMYEKFKSNDLHSKTKNVEKYSRRNLTKKLSELLKSL